MKSTLSWLQLYNKHKDETCLVIGNGPSLKNVPLDFLKKYPSFGSNRIYLLEGFTPTYYVCVNPLVRQQFEKEILGLDCTKFLGGGDPIPAPDIYSLRSGIAPLFSYSPMHWVYEGYTVTFVSLQLAYYMGFTTVLLVGVDHRYEFVGNPNDQVMAGGVDVNHFDEKYFSDVVWNNPDLERSTEAYILAREAYEPTGRKIINLTPNSALEVFEKGTIEEWM